MNEVTDTLSYEEVERSLAILQHAAKSWEPEFIPPPKETWHGGLIWRIHSFPIEVKGHPSEFVGKVKGVYEEGKQAILVAMDHKGHSQTYDVYGWRVVVRVDIDDTTNTRTNTVTVGLQAFLTKKTK